MLGNIIVPMIHKGVLIQCVKRRMAQRALNLKDELEPSTTIHMSELLGSIYCRQRFNRTQDGCIDGWSSQSFVLFHVAVGDFDHIVKKY